MQVDSRMTFLAFIFSLLFTLPLAAADEAFCRRFAETALSQFREAREAGCPDLKYPTWSEDFNHHYNWCRTVSEHDANGGTELRQQALDQCRASQSAEAVGRAVLTPSVSAIPAGPVRDLEGDCRNYAQQSIIQYQKAMEDGCRDLKYPVWSTDFKHHYDWCMRTSAAEIGTAIQQREQVRATCGGIQPGAATEIPEEEVLPPASTASATGTAGIAISTVDVIRAVLDKSSPAGTVSNIDLQAPVARQVLMESLLADPDTRARLQDIAIRSGRRIDPGLGGMTAQTLGGAIVAGPAITVGVNATGGTATGGGFSPTGAPRSASDFDWASGLHFSPFADAPTMYAAGGSRKLASYAISGIVADKLSLTEMFQKKTVYLGRGSEATLVLNLPRKNATYLVAFQIGPEARSGYDPSMRSLYEGPEAEITAQSGMAGTSYQDLLLRPLSGSRGFGTLLTVRAEDLADLGGFNAFLTLRTRSTTFPLFGGVTITEF